MGFVYEINTEEDRKKYNLDNYRDAAWAIDRERNAFLLWDMCTREMRDEAKFYWNGKIIDMIFFTDGTGNRNIGVKLFLDVYSLWIPKSLKPQTNEILDMIKEAIYIYKL